MRDVLVSCFDDSDSFYCEENVEELSSKPPQQNERRHTMWTNITRKLGKESSEDTTMGFTE